MNDDVDNGQVVIHQHKVPLKYLSAWYDHSGALLTLRREGNAFSCGAEGVEAEKYFYTFKDLAKEELRFLFHFLTTKQGLNMPIEWAQLRMNTTVGSALILGILADASQDRAALDSYMEQASALKAYSLEFLQQVREIRFFKYLGVPVSASDKKQMECIVKNGYEPRMCEVENNAWPALDGAVSARVCEINDNKDLKRHLAEYMVYQMMRGDKVLEAIKEDGRCLPPESLVRVASYLRFCWAESLWYNLEHRLDSMNFRLIENSTTEEFITGDNPVFNLDRSTPPSEFTLYFPVSPSRAVLLVSQSVESKYTRFLRPSIDDVKELNCRLCDACISQIHASRKDTFSRNAYRPRWVCPKPSR